MKILYIPAENVKAQVSRSFFVGKAMSTRHEVYRVRWFDNRNRFWEGKSPSSWYTFKCFIKSYFQSFRIERSSEYGFDVHSSVFLNAFIGKIIGTYYSIKVMRSHNLKTLKKIVEHVKPDMIYHADGFYFFPALKGNVLEVSDLQDDINWEKIPEQSRMEEYAYYEDQYNSTLINFIVSENAARSVNQFVKCEFTSFDNGADFSKLRNYTEEELNELKERFNIPLNKKLVSYIGGVHKFDKDFTLNNLDTPNWDKLIKHHIKDEQIYDIFNALIGRLFYPLKKYDNWQVMVFLIGSANTGKSTIIEIIQSFFYKRDIGSISSNSETTFGLQNLYDKRVVICPDIPHNIKKTLEASLLQSMVSGEQVNVPRKNLTALCVDFKAPMLWAGNYLPNYIDKSRSVSRRMATFKVNNEVKEKDTTLKQKIIENEIVALFIKFLTSYHKLRDKVKNITFEDWGRKLNIDYFDKQMEEFRRESDLLYQFITNPPGVNKTRNSNIWIEYKEGEITELETLKKKFKAFLNYKHGIQSYRWSNTSDHSTLRKEGYLIKRLHICAGCNKKAVKGCCDNFNRNNRRRKFVIENMVIRNEFIDDDYY